MLSYNYWDVLALAKFLTPNPVSLSSKAIHGLSVGCSASMTRLASVEGNFAVRFPVLVGMEVVRSWVAEAASNAHLDNSPNLPLPRMKMPCAAESIPELHFADDSASTNGVWGTDAYVGVAAGFDHVTAIPVRGVRTGSGIRRIPMAASRSRDAELHEPTARAYP